MWKTITSYSASESVLKREEWDKYESRLERNTHRLLEILDDCKPNPSSAWLSVAESSPQTSSAALYRMVRGEAILQPLTKVDSTYSTNLTNLTYSTHYTYSTHSTNA